jgi:hypothetical protein
MKKEVWGYRDSGIRAALLLHPYPATLLYPFKP